MKKLHSVPRDNTYPNRKLNIPELNINPGLFIIRIGFSCSSKCIHCFIEDKRIIKDLTLDELKQTISTIPKNAIVTVTGGEPTDRNDLIDILKYLKNNGYIINLETNGIKLSDMDYLKSISPFTDLFFIPIHSSDSVIFDTTTGVKGSFEKTMKGLENTMYTDVYHITISVFNRLNYETMLSTFDMIQERFPGQLMSLTFPHPVGAAHTKEIVPRYSEVREVIQAILKKYGQYMFVHYIPKCLTYPYHDVVIDIGKTDRYATDFVDNKWQEIKYVFDDVAKIKCSNCKDCIFDNECSGVWKEYVELYPDFEKDLIPITDMFVIDPYKLRFPNIPLEIINKVLSKNPNIEKEEILKDPIHYSLRIKYSCDNSCVHCFAETRKNIEDLTLDQIKNEIDQIPKGVYAVTITGGEPTTSKDLKEIMIYAKKKNLLVDLQTNGQKFSDKEYLNNLEPYLDSVLLPIHSFDVNINDAVTRRIDSGVNVHRAFGNLISSNIFVVTQTVINKLNYKSLVKTCDYIQSVSPGNTMLLTFPWSGGPAFSKEVTPRYSEIAPYLQEAFKKYAYLIQTHYIPKCYLYPYQTLVRNIDDTDNGSKYKPGLDFTKEKWEHVDYGRFDPESRVKSEKCVKCKFNSECLGVFKEYRDLYQDLDLNPIA